nr:MAG TPA: minor tail protein [Caudoviricetes sp.]
MELDSLEVKITGTATKAINSVDKLINQLTRLSTSLATVNGSSLSGLANGVSQLGSAMQNMNAGTADFTRLAKNITKIGSVDSVALTNTATSLQAVTKAVASISAIPQNATQVTEFAKSLGKLGSKSIENAIVNIPKLGNALNGLMTTLSRAPTVSQNVIQMTNALANLTSQGSKVGTSSNSLQKSLYGVSTSVRTATKSSWNLASAIGKFYATYFMVIRGSKKLIEAIKSTTDYIEAFNYQAVAFGKIGSEWDKDYEKYGYDNATAYAESFQSRVNDTLGKLSGLKVNVQGGLLEESGAKNLGLNIQEITQYASQLASVTNSLGQTGEATTAITKSMTMLAGDISSLFNVDYSTVAQNLQSGLIGQSRALYKYGIDITNATLATYAYNLGISKSVSEMTQMEKQQLRVLAILDQSKVSWGDLANTINSPSNMLRQFSNNMKEVGMVAGQLFIPILSKVMPIVNGVAIAIKRLLVGLASLMGVKIDFESFGQSGYKDTSDGLEDISDGYQDVADSAKKATLSLMGFDEINKLQDDTSSSKGSSGGGGGSTIDLTDDIAKAAAEYEAAWNKAFANMENSAVAWADRIEKALEPVKQIFKDFAVGDFFKAGQDTSNLVAGIFDWFAKAIDDVPWFKIGQKMGDFLAGINWTRVFKSAAKVLVQGLKAAVELYLGMLSKAPIETLLISLVAVPKVLKAIGGTNVIKSITKTYNKLNSLSKATEDVVLATKLSKMGYDETAATLLSFHPKLAKVTTSFKDFGNVVKDKGLFTALNGGIATARDNMTLFQKALLGGVSAFGEFKLIESGFYDIAKGSDNLVASIAKIAGGAAIGAAGLYTAFGPAGLAMAAVVGITGAIKGFIKVQEEIPDYLSGYESVRKEVSKTTSEIEKSVASIEETWKNNSSVDEIEALKTKYFELADQTNLTTEQQELLKDIAGKLVDKVPELSKAIDTNTGYYSGNRQEIEKLIEDKEKEYRLEALREEYIELAKEEYKAKKNLREMEDVLADSKDRLNEKQQEYNELTHNGALSVLEMTPQEADAVAGLQVEIRQLNGEVKKNQTEVDNARNVADRATNDMRYCYEALGDTAQEVAEKTRQEVGNTANTAKSEFETAKNEINSKINAIGTNTENVFSRMGSVGANAGSSLTNNFANNINDIPYRARDAFNEIISRVNAGDIGYDTGTELMDSLADTIDNNSWRIRRALSNSFESNFSGEILDSEGNVSRSAFQIRIPRAYATGGFPEDGLFFANHNEMVGKFSNGKTAVANNDQITQGIKQAVIEGMSEVFANANVGQQNGSIVVQIDGQEVFRTTQRYANQYTAMTGQPAFNI